MSPGIRRSRVPALLIAALAALLVFAAAASAETRTGESSTVIRENFPAGEVTLVKASASYESAGGSATFNITTATGAAPESESAIIAALTTATNCAGRKTKEAIVEPLLANPILGIADRLSSSTSVGLMGNFLLPQELPATKSVSGTTTTLSVSSSSVANKDYNCAIIIAAEAGEEGEGGEVDEEFPILEEPPGATLMSFPISVPAAPPVVTVPEPSPPPAPAAAPPVLKMARLKPLSLKTGKWQTVKIKVTNSGATGTGLGSLRVKTARGVLVKPERQQLPVLAPGASWTMTVRVQLGAKAKPKSTLKLTAVASGVTAAGSLVLKAQG